MYRLWVYLNQIWHWRPIGLEGGQYMKISNWIFWILEILLFMNPLLDILGGVGDENDYGTLCLAVFLGVTGIARWIMQKKTDR